MDDTQKQSIERSVAYLNRNKFKRDRNSLALMGVCCMAAMFYCLIA